MLPWCCGGRVIFFMVIFDCAPVLLAVAMLLFFSLFPITLICSDLCTYWKHVVSFSLSVIYLIKLYII